MKGIKIGGLSTSKVEITDIVKAWVAISIAFAVVLGGFSFSLKFLVIMLFAAVTVGVGFLFHELAHKVVAQRYGCFAEFRAFDIGLLIAVAFSFFGFIFAAPGAVVISGHVTRKENGLIAVVGPWTNIVIALLFLLVGIVLPELKVISSYGFKINAWLAVFNMIPAFILDGRKVWQWSKLVWAVTFVIGIALTFWF